MLNFDTLKPEIKKLAEKYGLSLVVLFGSCATGKTHAKSDIDIGIAKRQNSWSEDLSSVIIEIEKNLSDVLKRDDIEVIDLYDTSPTLMRSIVEEGKSLYESSPGEFDDWKLFAIRVWMETKWLRDRSREHLKSWAKNM